MHSAVFIIPAAYRDAGNALGEAMGWGSGNYSVALSPTGAEPATHYGCRADVTGGFLALMADPPPEAAPVLAVLHTDITDTDDAYGHWTGVLAGQGLQVVTDAEWIGYTEDEGSPTAQPDRITAIVMEDPQAAIAVLGLVRVE